jgi:hypothetical protein
MRVSGFERERERGDWPRLHYRKSRRRSFSSEVRSFGGEWGPSRVPPKGGNGDDWLDARP